MRWILVCLFAWISPTLTLAAVYKCVDGTGETTFQQIPCKDNIKTPPVVIRDSLSSTAGYNATCTHYKGRKVLGLKALAALGDAQRSEYVDWLYDEGPSKEEKEACHARKNSSHSASSTANSDDADLESYSVDAQINATDTAVNNTDSAAATMATDVAVAANDSQAGINATEERGAQTAADDKAGKQEALRIYSLSRTLQTQIQECRNISEELYAQAMDSYVEFSEENSAVIRTGSQIAVNGYTINADSGDVLTPDEIEKGILAKKAEISARFRSANEDSRDALASECASIPASLTHLTALTGF